MGGDYQVAALWIGGDLSYLEQLCLKSFLDAGHHVRLYSYHPIANAPEGVEHAAAGDILPLTGFLRHARTSSPALHSDLFRYHLLARCDRTIWVDTDAYCVRRFVTGTGHFFGWESDKHVNGGVLGLPRDSEALAKLIAFTQDEHAIPVWYGKRYVADLEAARDAGHPVHVGDQPWGVWGPHALTHFLRETGEIRHALPPVALYPFAFRERAMMTRPGVELADFVTGETFSIHFYGRRMRARLVEKFDGVPRPRSVIGRLLRQHGVDPALAPIPLRKGEAADREDDED
jgi:hypothetical protein